MTVCSHHQQVDLIGFRQLRQDVSDRSPCGIDFIDDNADPVPR